MFAVIAKWFAIAALFVLVLFFIFDLLALVGNGLLRAVRKRKALAK